MENSGLSLISLPSMSNAHCQGGHKGCQSAAELLRASRMGTRRPRRERLNIESVFSAARGAHFQSFSICTLFSNDSSRVITVLFTNEVWKMRERGEAVNSPAGMRRLSPREREASILLPAGLGA